MIDVSVAVFVAVVLTVFSIGLSNYRTISNEEHKDLQVGVEEIEKLLSKSESS